MMNLYRFKSNFKTILLLLVFVLFSFSNHKYYVSLTDINYNKESKSLEIITNVFIDDIELELNKKYNLDLQLNTKKQYPKSDSIFKTYFSEKLTLKVNDKQQNFHYIGVEFEGDLVFIYQEIKNIETPKEVEILNKILIQEFEDQQNVVKIKVGKQRKSKILDKKTVKSLLKF